MSNTIFPKIAFILLAAMCLSLCGCQPKTDDAGDGAKLTESVGPDTTIRSLGEIYRPSPIQVKGFGIVVGLAGTGSSECPPLLRDALVKYILQQVSDKSKIYPEIPRKNNVRIPPYPGAIHSFGHPGKGTGILGAMGRYCP